MGAYGNIDNAVAGLKDGLYSRVASRVAAEAIPLGYPIFTLKGETESCGLLNNDESAVLFDADFVASNVISVTVSRPGPIGETVQETVQVTFDTDQATTLAALVAALDALDGIDAAGTGAREVTLNSDDGAAIAVSGVTVTGGVSQAGSTVTPANSGDQVFAGVSLLTHNTPVPYEAGKMVNILHEGAIWVYCATSCSAGNDVYYNSSGEFANAGTAIANAVFETNLSAAGLAKITINKP
jgi:hypothetical protein